MPSSASAEASSRCRGPGRRVGLRLTEPSSGRSRSVRTSGAGADGPVRAGNGGAARARRARRTSCCTHAVVHRVGALEPGLHLGDPAQGRELEEAEDVVRGVRASGSSRAGIGSTASALSTPATAGSVAPSRILVAQPGSPAPAAGRRRRDGRPDRAVRRVGEVVGADVGVVRPDQAGCWRTSLSVSRSSEPRVTQVGQVGTPVRPLQLRPRSAPAGRTATSTRPAGPRGGRRRRRRRASGELAGERLDLRVVADRQTSRRPPASRPPDRLRGRDRNSRPRCGARTGRAAPGGRSARVPRRRPTAVAGRTDRGRRARPRRRSGRRTSGRPRTPSARPSGRPRRRRR